MSDLGDLRNAAAAALNGLRTLPSFETLTVTISISPIEVTALKKLSLISHALAKQLSGGAAQEQTVLASVLDELIRQIEIKAAGGPAR